MNIKRMWHSFRLMTMPKWPARKKYLQKHNIYGKIGENSHIQSPFIPLYAELIHLHNNVVVAKDVMFITHDLIHRVANRMDFDGKLSEGIGCIEILDNVFVGAKATIMPNVRIGPNAIVAAGSVVTKDVPENSIVGGVPARVIGKFDETIKATLQKEKEGRRSITTHNQNLTRDEIENAWKMFRDERVDG